MEIIKLLKTAEEKASKKRMKPLIKRFIQKLVIVKFIFTIPMISIKQKLLNQEPDMAVVKPVNV